MNALIIDNTQIRRDPSGRYCLNDLHQASGSEKRHEPNRWLRCQQAVELVAELSKLPISGQFNSPDLQNLSGGECEPVVTVEGRAGGTYTVKELVYAYAMWISAKFHLHVIRAYDALTTAQPSTTASLTGPQQKVDQMVGGGRIFNAAFRTARTMGFPRSQALSSANAVALRHAAVDWVQELDAAEHIAAVPLHIAGMGDWPESTAIISWLQDQTEVGAQDVIDGALGGLGHDDHAVLLRIGRLMAQLGWTKYRPRSRGGRFVYRRPGT